MARRSPIGCLAAWVVVMAALIACGKDKQDGEAGKTEKADTPTTPDFDKRCVQLAKTCGDQAKHVDKITEACKLAAKKQLEKGCAGKVLAAYDCYEKALCNKTEKVWAIEDLAVLADRHGKCMGERDAARACVDK